jgi:cobalt-zinc-cadmium efflux system protein
MTRSQRLLAVLALNLALVAGLVAVGAVARSLAVLATGGDYLLDAAAVGIALLAARLAGRQRKRPVRSGRVDPVSAAALINAGWLLVLELLVAAAAVTRLAAGTPRVSGLPVLLVSGLAAVVMTAAALILRGDDPDPGDGDRDVSVAAVLLDTVADAAAAAGTAVAGGIILATGGWYWLDPAVALVIALVVAAHAVALIRKVVARLRAARGGEPGTTG